MPTAISHLILEVETRLPVSGAPVSPRLRIDLDGRRPTAASLSPLGTTRWMISTWEAALADLGLAAAAPGSALKTLAGHHPCTIAPTAALVARLSSLSGHELLRLRSDHRIRRLYAGDTRLVDR